MAIKEISDFLKLARDLGIYPDIHEVEGISTSTEVKILNKKVLMFSSNNYLGIAGRDELKHAAIDAVNKYGIGSGGSRLMTGNTDIQNILEKEVSDFKNTEAAMTFVTGYMANSGCIPALVDSVFENLPFQNGKSIIFSDENNHASIVDGCRLSHAQKVIYKHNDISDLQDKLSNVPIGGHKFIITDSVFSMDGDIANLPEIVNLAEKYNAHIMIDDAHGTGVLGKNGRGALEYFGIPVSKIDVIMGTFTKAFGAIGGFIATSKDVVDFLKVVARTYIFTAPIPPSIVAALIQSIEIVKNHPELCQKVQANARYFREKMQENGIDILKSETQIIPVIISDERRCMSISRQLLENGIYAPAVMWPAVPKGKSRLRVTIMSSHTIEQIDYFITTLVKLLRI